MLHEFKIGFSRPHEAVQRQISIVRLEAVAVQADRVVEDIVKNMGTEQNMQENINEC